MAKKQRPCLHLPAPGVQFEVWQYDILEPYSIRSAFYLQTEISPSMIQNPKPKTHELSF